MVPNKDHDKAAKCTGEDAMSKSDSDRLIHEQIAALEAMARDTYKSARMPLPRESQLPPRPMSRTLQPSTDTTSDASEVSKDLDIFVARPRPDWIRPERSAEDATKPRPPAWRDATLSEAIQAPGTRNAAATGTGSSGSITLCEHNTAQDQDGRVAPLANMRFAARAFAVLAVAGTGALLLATWPFGSGGADARVSAAVEIPPHRERITLESVDITSPAVPAILLEDTTIRTVTTGQPDVTLLAPETPLERAVVEIDGIGGPLDLIPSTETEPASIALEPETTPEVAQADETGIQVAALPSEIEMLPVQGAAQIRENAGMEQPEATPAETDRPSASITITPEMEALFQRGRLAMEKGQIAGARLIYQRLANQGHAEAAFALAETYDARILRRMAVYGIQPDTALARKYYELARDLGIEKAEQRLSVLARME